MKDYEQMRIDMTLDADRSLKDNIQNVAKFALEQIIRHEHPKTVGNRHEGYGIASEYDVSLRRSMKMVDVDMKSMLALLPNGEGDFINVCGSLYNSAIETAVSAIKLAAQSQRILEDLYDSETRTPLEDYLDGSEASGGDEEAGGGFVEAEPATAGDMAEAAENEED